MASKIAGRDAELASVRDFVSRLEGGASALVLEGEEGVGKTTVWAAAAEEAEAGGLVVLRSRPSAGEAALSFSGLGDLLDTVVQVALEPLPELQRRALSHALVLEPGGAPAPETRAIGVAVLSVLRALSDKRPLLLAIDDVQWLDLETSSALAYAGRRLTGERLGFLLTRRSALASAFMEELRQSLPSERYEELHIETLGPAALHDVVVTHLNTALSAPLLGEVHAASGGNPFYALEIVRMLQRRGGLVAAGQPLPVPDSLQDLVQGRLSALPAESRDFLAALAAHPSATAELLETAVGVSRAAGLAPALQAGVVELEDDRIRFTHPLLASGAYELATESRRRELHERLAHLVDDPEARGRHLAVATTAPSRAVAIALDEAASHAFSRGAPRAAGLLLERALALTPSGDDEGATRRALDAAGAHYEAGDTYRARRLLEAELERLSGGNDRARALLELGRVHSDGDVLGAAALYEQAAAAAAPGSLAQALAREGLATTLLRLRARLAEAVELSARAAEAARVYDVPVLRAAALATKALAEAALGRPEAATSLGDALALQDLCLERPLLRQPRFAAAVVRFWHDDLVGAERAYQDMAALAARLGDESSVPYIQAMLAQVHVALGRFEHAVQESAAGERIAEQARQRTLIANLRAVRAVAEAHLGVVERATHWAAKALEDAGSTSGTPAWTFASWALGHLVLSQGDPARALEHLEPLQAHHRREAIAEPGALPFMADYLEALVESGRVEAAVTALEPYETAAQRLERGRGVAVACRIRGLLAAVADDLPEACEELEEAVRLAQGGETPFDHARALLSLGAAQRRSKRRREARETLERSVAAFERLGAALWAERARAELHRVSGRAPAGGGLTPAEARIAALVAEGKTNREVAAALFLSERTVEGHLSRVYGKLGVRSRTELARALVRETTGSA